MFFLTLMYTMISCVHYASASDNFKSINCWKRDAISKNSPLLLNFFPEINPIAKPVLIKNNTNHKIVIKSVRNPPQFRPLVVLEHCTGSCDFNASIGQEFWINVVENITPTRAFYTWVLIPSYWFPQQINYYKSHNLLRIRRIGKQRLEDQYA